MQKLNFNQKGISLIITLLILTSIILIPLILASIIISNVKMGRQQNYSTKAYFAAEAGIEKSLWEVRKNNYVLPNNDQDNIFSATLDNGASYQVNYATSSPYVYFTSIGTYQDIKRSVQINFQSE